MKENERQSVFLPEEQQLFALLRESLTGREEEIPTTCDWEAIGKLARDHAVYTLLQPALERLDDESSVYEECRQAAVSTVRNNYRLLFLTKYVSELLEQAGVGNAVLKGISTASLYPVPELRKSGDVDLMLYGEYSVEQITEVMERAGFTLSKEQNVSYHLGFLSPGNVEIELHTSFSEPFDLPAVNKTVEQMKGTFREHVIVQQEYGFPVRAFDLPYHAFQLLIHMLHHFLRSGFGLKLLCDWVVLWKQDWSEGDFDCLKRLLEDSKLTAFARAVTGVCVEHLGLDAKRVPEYLRSVDSYDGFLREILDAEEFGASDSARMVVMKRSGLFGYVTEFHHQMHLNFPRAGKVFLLWPILWVITLVRFLRNNRQLGRGSAGSILKEASRRSKLAEELGLLR